MDDKAMPVAVQLVAKPGGEKRLLELAAQIEAAKPWPRHAPRYTVDATGSTGTGARQE
ncbi:hypothetical protein [Streptomyces sp. LN500]|uniref:hypothetical protein n=1 Tax=Streptomyces sp. LN500 TaxID=3112978 RepID=UPI0037125E77